MKLAKILRKEDMYKWIKEHAIFSGFAGSVLSVMIAIIIAFSSTTEKQNYDKNLVDDSSITNTGNIIINWEEECIVTEKKSFELFPYIIIINLLLLIIIMIIYLVFNNKKQIFNNNSKQKAGNQTIQISGNVSGNVHLDVKEEKKEKKISLKLVIFFGLISINITWGAFFYIKYSLFDISNLKSASSKNIFNVTKELRNFSNKFSSEYKSENKLETKISDNKNVISDNSDNSDKEQNLSIDKSKVELQYNDFSPVNEKVIAAHSYIPIYDSCEDNSTKKNVGIYFKNTFYVTKQANQKIFIVDVNKLGGITKNIGWANINNFVLSDTAIKSKHNGKNSLVYKKAMIINKSGITHKSEFQKAEVFDHFDVTKNKKINEVGIFEFFYIFTPKGLLTRDFELLGNANSINNMENPSEIIGWVPKNRLMYWNHRIALEINKDIKALHERIEKEQPVVVFSDQATLKDFYNSNHDGNNYLLKLHKTSKVKAIEDLSFAKRWPQSVKRWPILNSEELLSNKLGNLNSYHVGVIGDIQFFKDSKNKEADYKNTEYPKNQFIRWQECVEDIHNSINNIDILLLIEATNHIKQFFPAISEGIIGAMRKINQKNRKCEIRSNIRFAIAVYPSPDDSLSFNWLTMDNQNQMFHSNFQFASDILVQNQSSSKQKPYAYTLNMLGALYESLNQANFLKKHSYRVIYQIGIEDSLKEFNYQSINEEYKIKSIIDKLKSKKVKLNPILIRDKQNENKTKQFDIASDIFQIQYSKMREINQIWVNKVQEVKASQEMIANAIFNQILVSEDESRMAKCMINLFLQGHNKDYILNHTNECSISEIKFDDDSIVSPSIKYDVLMRVSDMICSVTSPQYVEMKRIQAFDAGFILHGHPELSYKFIKPVVLLSRSDLQILVGILSAASEKMRPNDLGTLWKNLFKRMTGENINLEQSFAEYMEIIGIPIKSSFLKNPLAFFNESTRKIPTKELNEYYDIIREKWEALSDYSQEKNNFFSVRNHKYTWLDIDLLP